MICLLTDGNWKLVQYKRTVLRNNSKITQSMQCRQTLTSGNAIIVVLNIPTKDDRAQPNLQLVIIAELKDISQKFANRKEGPSIIKTTKTERSDNASQNHTSQTNNASLESRTVNNVQE